MANMRTGVVFEGLRGKVGNVVVIPTTDGVIVREWVVPRNPRTAAQMTARNRQTRAARGWAGLSLEADARWKAYAQSLHTPGPRTGTMVSPRPDNVFTALYSRMLLLDPLALPPQFPPATAFFGDAISVTISLPLGRGRGGDEGLTAFPEGLTGEDLGVLTFAASGPNANGVVTELLIQPLANPKRKTYLDKYRHAAVATFTAGHLTQTVPLASGWYACAYRFIRADTGQATSLAEIGVVWVA